MSTQVNNPASQVPAWGILPGSRPSATASTSWPGPETSLVSSAPIPLLPLPFIEPVSRRSPTHTAFLYTALWTWPLPARPTSGLHCRPTMPSLAPAGPPAGASAAPEPASKPWESISRFWTTAPPDLRWLAVSLPVILLIVLYSTTRSTHRQDAPLAKPVSVVRTDSPRSPGVGSTLR